MTFGGSVAFAAGNQVHLLSRTYTSPLPSRVTDMRVHVRELNGVLPDYHPQLLVQCLLAGGSDLTRDIKANQSADVQSISQAKTHW